MAEISIPYLTPHDDDRRWVSLYSPRMPAEMRLQVDAMAGALAGAWADRVRHGDRVAILNQNTPATIIGLLAAWRLGAAVMPLSPMLTRRELVHFLMDGEPSAAIVGVEQARV